MTLSIYNEVRKSLDSDVRAMLLSFDFFYTVTKMLIKILCGSHWSRTTIAILIVFFLSGCGSSSPSSSGSYNETITEGQIAANELIAQKKASMISIALVDANHIIWTETFGVADPTSGQAPTDTTMLGIGSVSKIFATIAVMKLVERGVVDLDTPLVSYLPTFKMASEGYEKITVRMLLNHSAGFPGTDYRNADIRTAVPEYPDQVLQTLSQARLKAPPGYMSVYCNDCFTVIGSGQSNYQQTIQAICQRRDFDPSQHAKHALSY